MLDVFIAWQEPEVPKPPLKLVLVGSHAMSPAAAITGSVVADARIALSESNPKVTVRTLTPAPSRSAKRTRLRRGGGRGPMCRSSCSRTGFWPSNVLRQRQGLGGNSEPNAIIRYRGAGAVVALNLTTTTPRAAISVTGT